MVIFYFNSLGKLAAKLVKISEEMVRGTYKPEDNDPVVEMEGEILLIYPALSKENLKGKTDWRVEIDEKKKTGTFNANDTKGLLRGIKTLEDLVEKDKKGKRNLELAVRGLYKSTDPMVKSKIDIGQRETHETQKLEKLKNPNSFVSNNKIFIKNVEKSLDEKQVRSLVIDCFGQKNISRKILKKTKLYFDKESNKFNGSVHLEFIKPEDALTFITKIETDEKAYSQFNLRRVPIIEFALENAQKVLKTEQILKSVKQKTNIRKKEIIDEKVKTKGENQKQGDNPGKKKLDEGKEIKKQQIDNNKKIVGLRFNKIESGEIVPTKKDLVDLLDLVYGRGPKQRMKQKLRAMGQLGDSQNQTNTDTASQSDFIKKRKNQLENSEKRQVKSEETKQLKKREQNKKDALAKRMPDEERQVVNAMKNRKRLKTKAAETDDFDEQTENYIKKKEKKNKWFNFE